MNIDKILENKKITISALVIVIIGIVVGIVVMVYNMTPHFPDVNDGPGEEVNEKSLVFYERGLLTAAYNIEFSATVLDNIQTVVFSEEEMRYSKNNTPEEGEPEIYYDAVINVASFRSYDAYMCKFEVEISDERKYEVMAGTDSLDENYNFVYTAIKRKGGEKIYIQTTGEENELATFLEFVKSKMTGEVVIIEDAETREALEIMDTEAGVD